MFSRPYNKSQQFTPVAPDTHFVRAAVLNRYLKKGSYRAGNGRKGI